MSAEQLQNNLDLPKGTGQRGTRGRKDKDGGEEPLKLKPDLKKQCRHLMTLYAKKELASKDYNEAAKKIAEGANANTSVIKKAVAASAKGKFEETNRIVQQTAELFDYVGEVQTSDPAAPATDTVQ